MSCLPKHERSYTCLSKDRAEFLKSVEKFALSYTFPTCHIFILFPRPFTTRSTPLPAMCGALDVSCMRSGVSDTSHLKATIILKCGDNFWKPYKYHNYGKSTYTCIGDQNDRQGLPSPSPSWINQRALQNHDSMLVCA